MLTQIQKYLQLVYGREGGATLRELGRALSNLTWLD